MSRSTRLDDLDNLDMSTDVGCSGCKGPWQPAAETLSSPSRSRGMILAPRNARALWVADVQLILFVVWHSGVVCGPDRTDVGSDGATIARMYLEKGRSLVSFIIINTC